MDRNIEKLDFLTKQAEIKSQSNDLVDILGASTIYTGLVDFFIIQSARVVEQIIAKEQLFNLNNTSLELHHDVWFFDKKVSSRKILTEIEKLVPFKNRDDLKEIEEINETIGIFLKSGHVFLDNRNKIIHGLGNPANSLDELENICKEGFLLYKDFEEKHATISLKLAPYTLTEEQRKLVYK